MEGNKFTINDDCPVSLLFAKAGVHRNRLLVCSSKEDKLAKFVQAWDPGANASRSLAHEYRLSLENLETQSESILVRHNFSKHLLSSGVDHSTKRFVA